MRRIKYTPYMLDMDYEFKTYKNVGRDYGNAKTANGGWIFNYLRFRRKRKNREETYYKFCNTYSEWKMHVQHVLDKHICNYDDLIHWLIKERNSEMEMLEIVKAVLIPIYIAMLSMYEVFSNKIDSQLVKLSYMVCLIFMAALYSVIYLSKSIERVNFYDDFIEIAEEMR